MKKLILFLILITTFGFAQPPTNPTVFNNGIKITGGQPTVTSVNYLTTTDASGLQGKIDPINLPFSNTRKTQNPIDYRGKNIHWFGDSYTQGSGASTTDNRFTSIVTRALGAVEVNHGVAGTTMEKRIPIDYMASPNMVDNVVNIPVKVPNEAMIVFAFGLNDMGQTAPDYSTTNYKTDYQFVINSALSKGWLPSQILIIPAYYIGSAGYAVYATITGNAAPTQARHLAFIQAAKEVSEANGTMYFDIYQDQTKNSTTLLDPDNIHPNNAGHAYIAFDVLQYLGADKLNLTNSNTFDLTAGFIPNVYKNNVLKNSLIYDTGMQIGIGITTPQSGLHTNSTNNTVANRITNSVSGSSSADGGVWELDSSLDLNFINKENAGVHFFTNNVKRASYLNNGRYLFATTTDNGVNGFQINTDIKANGFALGTTTLNNQTPVHLHIAGSNYLYQQFTNGDTGQNFGDGIIYGIGNDMALNVYNFENAPINFATNGVVRQTIASNGKTTFTETVTVPNASLPTEAPNYGQVTSLDAGNVKLIGNQNVSGIKSFLNAINIDSGASAYIGFNSSGTQSTGYNFPMLARTGNFLALRGSSSTTVSYGALFDLTQISGSDKTFQFPNASGVIALDNGSKTYNALITQSGTGAPTVTVLGNNTIGAIVWTRTATGIYVGTLSGAFTASKCAFSFNNTVPGSITIKRTSANTIEVTTSDLTGTLLDGRLTENTIKIEVFP